MTERILVPFAGAGRGVEPLTWGMRELWGGMQRQRTWMPLGGALPLPAGTTVDGMAAELRFLMERYPSMRTRLRLRAYGPPVQVLEERGELPVEILDVPDGTDPGAYAEQVRERYWETAFDFEQEWPARVALIRHRGVLTHYVPILCHLVADGFGVLIMTRELLRRRRDGGVFTGPPTPMPPLEQARWQSSAAGQRTSATVLRYWENQLRTIAPRRFPGPVAPREPRHWCAGFTSRALHLAARSIARRAGAEPSHVLLAAFATALARETGIHPVVTRLVVSNRFRPGLAGTVSPISQTGLCVLDVADAPFEEVVAQAGRRALAAYKYAYYDPEQMDAMLARVCRERGEEVDIACYFNDRRLEDRDDGGPAPAAAEILDALAGTGFRWVSRLDVPSERLFLHINNAPDTVDISLFADTRYVPPATMEGCLRGMEEIAVRAALPARTG
ncbi:MAG TPA: condensation domain-containing protein [Rugosimonospora sp.]|nr:condensation domain-containing protein [Rugosimonospora sp.]